MKNVESVMNYFARYANRVCISQSRIKEFDMSKNTVTFKYKDYKDNAQEKYMTLDAIEFMRRFYHYDLEKYVSMASCALAMNIN